MMPGRRVAIAGVGYSTIGRHTGLSSDELVRQSTLAALEDAGLGVSDVDGLVSVGSDVLTNAWMLGIVPPRWWNSAMSAPAFIYAAEQATWTAGQAIQALGGMGYVNETAPGRLLRDAKLYEIGAGTSEIRRWLIGRELYEETA